MKKRIEFPLFELMLIIILFLVLTIFAFPKFIGVGVEARIKALNATAFSLRSVNRILYSRALIKGVHNNALQTTEMLVEKDTGSYLVYGELRAQEHDIKQFLESDLTVYVKINRSGVVRLYLDNNQNNGCYIDYQQAQQRKLQNGQSIIQKATYTVNSFDC